MITLRDCVDLSGCEPDEIDAVAEHEGLAFIVAMEKECWMLDQPWGPPAVRQMIKDDLRTAAQHGSWRHVDELMTTYHHTSDRLPIGCDRRHGMRH